jgi:hypothetical protein
MARTTQNPLDAQISALVAQRVKDMIDYHAEKQGITQGDVIRAALAKGLAPVKVNELEEWLGERRRKAETKLAIAPVPAFNEPVEITVDHRAAARGY